MRARLRIITIVPEATTFGSAIWRKKGSCSGNSIISFSKALRARALFALAAHRNKKRVIKFALRPWHLDGKTAGERTIRPNGLQNKSKWKTQRDKFPKFHWERVGKLAFLHTQPGKQNKECGGGWAQYRPVQLSHLSIARLANTYLFVCEWRAEANLSSHRPGESIVPCRFGTHKQIRIMPLS